MTHPSALLLPALVLLLAACHAPAAKDSAPTDSEGGETAADTADSETGDTVDTSVGSWSALAPWARPIDDYIAENEKILGNGRFMKGIFDLVVDEGRLYLGYGDANLNLGRNTPIEARFFPKDDPKSVTHELTTDEEQIDHYRTLDGVLAIPGVDATEDDFMGNAYVDLDSGWVKSRTLEWAWHVHDMARLGDVLYACGSGGSEDDYNNGTVNAYLYRSDDAGRNYTIIGQFPHPTPPGDNRFTNLLTVGGHLYVFGYVSDYKSINALTAFEEVGGKLESIPGFPTFFVTETLSLNDELGLVSGVRVASTLKWQTLLVTSEGTEVADAFDGLTVLDAKPTDGGMLVLWIDGDEYPTPGGPWTLGLGITTDGTDLEVLMTRTTDTWPWTAASWDGALYLGLDDGSIWRSEWVVKG